ncbi:RHS repeat domain-containing protein [Kribbella sp. NPDC056951]|uniref:RHS repeat domain-containing protein n=1 Tax=Kribbella sp. NPDC056951 TaxID=3345978 RepID=UPI003639779F
MPQRRRHLPRATLACVVVISLLVSTPGMSAAVDRPTKQDPKAGWQARKDRPLPVQGVAAKRGTADRDAERTVTSIPAPVWPKAGTAEVSMPPAQPVSEQNTWGAVLSGQAQQAGPGPAARAGVLPVRIGRPGSQGGLRNPAVTAPGVVPAKVAVELTGRVGDEVRLRLRRADGLRTPGVVSLRLDYSSFKQAFGGDWSTRLRLASVPACAATTPGKPSCAAVPLPTRNDGSAEVSADVPVGAEFTTFALQAAPSGPSGDSTTTSLSPTATWQVGGSSGDFSWAYPMQVPPSLIGPKAEVSLAYSSGSVDGRTTAGNSQSSWAGAGFDLAPGGSIERRYASCGVKSEQTGNNGTTAVGDYCWATDNATFSLNGAGGELVLDDQTGVWKSRSDDGVTVERLTGADNGDLGPDSGAGAKGEYWLLTDKAGTKFYFGKNKLPGATTAAQDTNSVWTLPVFGNHASEPCHQTAFAASHCQQAYRWNLDYVVDAFGNTMSLFYDVEKNNYARAGTATSVSQYTRAGNIRRIEYGQRDGQVFDNAAKVAAVEFTTAERCLKPSGCVASDYPDTPLDLECTSTTNCDNKFYPSFWTKKRLAKVTTQVWRGTAFAPVSTWSFRHVYLDPQDEGRSPMLWLDGVTNVGLVAGQTTLPETTFSAVMMPNRLLDSGSAGQPKLNWPRMQTITYGTGGQIAVGYLPPDCSLPGNVPAPDQNTKRCQPIKWTPQNQAEREDWFHKYVVNQVTESDLVGGTTGTVTTLEYLTPPAWRYDDEDGLVEIGKKTWSQWRGYEKVKVITGNGVDGPQQVKVNTYYRGMDGDKLQAGGTKDVQVTDSTGVKTDDVNALSGKLREQATYEGTTLVERSITDHWVSPARATRVKPWGTTTANQVDEQAVAQDEAVGAGWRKSASANTFDPVSGRLVAKTDRRDLANPNDDVCVRYEWFSNLARGIKELPAREQTVNVSCDKPWTKDNVLADEKTGYDANTGAKVATQRLAGFDTAGKEIYQTTSTSTYDVFGRVRSSTDAKSNLTNVEYTPTAGGPLTKTKTTQPNGQTSTTELEPAWGEETVVIDPAGRRSATKRDALGRVTETWLAGNTTSVPNQKNEYHDGQGKAGMVTSTSLRSDGRVEVKREFSDGLMRRRQTQEESADGFGRVVTDYIYDSQGREVKQNGPYYNDAPLGLEIVKPVDEKSLPAQKLTTYDALGRAKTETFQSVGQQLWNRKHDNATGVETIEPPAGEQATTRVTDIQGRLIELRSYHGSTATGVPDKTSYTYHPAGQLASVTDPAGNIWRYTYDVRGRKVSDQTPDQGLTTYTYNELDQLQTSKDARGVTQTYTYDAVGRPKTTTVDGTLLNEWTYDTIKVGSLTSATRYVNGQPYRLQYTGYDEAGRPTGQQIVLPATEGNLAGTYSTTRTYTEDGQPKTFTVPAVGGLPTETLTYEYDKRSRPITLTGADRYVTETDYTPYGETSRIKMERGANWAEQLFDFEEGTHQLKGAGMVTPNGLESNVQYSYDAAGNITEVTDTPTTQAVADRQCFDYDYYRRLTQAWTPAGGNCDAAPSQATLGGPAPYWHSWTFDVTGNRKTEKRTTPAGETVSTYEYPAAGQARPHAVQKVTTTGPGVNKVDQYTYDAAGNLKTRTQDGTADSLTWTGDGKLDTVAGTGRTTKNIYDANGTQLLRKDASGTTLSLGDTELLLKPDGSLVGTRYYSLGGQKVAIRTGATKLTWVSSDHHGTMNVSVDADSLAVQRRRMTPYGELRGATPTWPGQRGFVGGLQDVSTGLVQLGARAYDPKLGRFISVDPVTDVEDPQQLNAYAYGNNSPVSFSDPDGRRYVTETVTMMRTVIKTVYKRIVEQKQILERKRVFVRVLSAAQSVLKAVGLHALAQILGYWITVEIKRMIKIHRTIKELVKVQERVTRKLKRWVGDAESKQLDALLKKSTDILADAARQVAQTVARWYASQRGVNNQGKNGSDVLALGGGKLLSMGGPDGDEELSDEDPEQPGWFEWLKAFGTAGGAAGGAAACAPAAPVTGGAAPWVCGAAGGKGASDLFDWIWDMSTTTPAEAKRAKDFSEKTQQQNEWCHTYNGC